jgi:hypothetical protein
MRGPFVARQRVVVLLGAQLVPVLLGVALWLARPELHLAAPVGIYLAMLWMMQLSGLVLAARFIARTELFHLAALAIVVFAGVPLNGLLLYAFTAR